MCKYFHLVPEDVVHPVAALPHQPHLVGLDGQVTHEAGHLNIDTVTMLTWHDMTWHDINKLTFVSGLIIPIVPDCRGLG